MRIGFSGELKGTNLGAVFELIDSTKTSSGYDPVICSNYKTYANAVVAEDKKSLKQSKCQTEFIAGFNFQCCLPLITVPKNASRFKNGFVVGNPSMDVLHSTEDEKGAIKLVFLRYAGLDEKASTILFNSGKIPGTDRRKVINSLIDLSKDHNLVFRLPQHSCPLWFIEQIKDSENCYLQIKEEEPDIVPVLLAADKLVTNTLQGIEDYLVLQKPIIFLGDSEYSECGTAVNSLNELLAALSKTTIQKVNISDYVPFTDGECAERIVSLIVEKYKEFINEST